MPGKKKGSKKNKNVKKQVGELKEVNNPTKQKNANDPTPAKVNLNDAILVEEVILHNDQGINNQSMGGAKSPFDAFVSKFDVGEQTKPKEAKST